MAASDSDSWRWQVQHAHMRTDPLTGVDERVLSRLKGQPASSHTLYTRDGTRIHYKRFGQGAKTLVFCNGLGGTYRTFADVFVPLLDEFTVLVADYRGLFESGRPSDMASLTVPQHANDLREVLDHAGVEDVILFGWSMGVQVCLESWRLFADRIRAMVFASGVDGRLLNSALSFPGSRRVIPTAVRWMRDHGGPVSAALARAVQAGPVIQAARTLGLIGRNADTTMEHAALLFSTEPDIYWRIVECLQEHDATEVLPDIEVPVLILHGDADVLTPVSHGRMFRTRIPRSEIWVFHGCTHAVILEYPERVREHTLEFLRRRLLTSP